MKKFFEPLSTAWIAVITHKLRSFLTILGVVIGIAAVIILMSAGRGAEASILKNISNLGANMITIRSGAATSGGVRGGFGSAGTLTLEDAQAIEANVTNINGVSPTSSSAMQVIYRNQNMNVQITGITLGYFEINNVLVQEGDYLTQDEYSRYAKVAVIGPNISSTLFQGDDPVGQTLRMGSNIFTVVGVMQSKGESFTSTDNMILVPLSTLQGIAARSITTTGQHLVNSITVQASDKDSIASVKQQITLILEDRHKIAVGAEDDFNLTSTDELTATITSSMQSFDSSFRSNSWNFTACGWDRSYEYYARLSHGEETGDRYPQSSGR